MPGFGRAGSRYALAASPGHSTGARQVRAHAILSARSAQPGSVCNQHEQWGLCQETALDALVSIRAAKPPYSTDGAERAQAQAFAGVRQRDALTASTDRRKDRVRRSETDAAPNGCNRP